MLVSGLPKPSQNTSEHRSKLIGFEYPQLSYRPNVRIRRNALHARMHQHFKNETLTGISN